MLIDGKSDGDGRAMPSGDEVVISGMSGQFPKSENVTEFMENLYNKVNMVVEVQSDIIHPVYPKYQGKIVNTNKFDAHFFKVTYNQAISLHPMCRQLMTYAYAAIYDSGINPVQMNGKKVGVFIASSNVGDQHMLLDSKMKNSNKFFISGCSKSMYANRISYWINSKSPSFYIDCACTGSLAAVHLAYNSILIGDCDAALVGGCNVCLSSTVTVNLNNAGLLCSDGKTKCFDKRGDGYARAESIGLMFLQKAKDAKRIYAEIYHTALGFSSSPRSERQFLCNSNSKDMINFLMKFYSEIDVSPQEVEYVEAHGIAVAEDDKKELEAIGEIFGNKEKPVKIGCVKSNMGNSESASGLCALAKVCLAYRKGELPANLHYSNPQDGVEAVRNGKIEVVQENLPFKRGFAAINSFSYTGSNVHVLLKGHYKEKKPKQYKTNVPYLVNVSSRNEVCVESIFDILASAPIDAEYIGLLHNIHNIEIPGHTARGYIILGSNYQEKTHVFSKSIEYYTGIKPPVCFLYSGMGSQWCGMGADLMNIPIFFEAIEKCAKVLEPKGVDLIYILTSNDQTIFEDILKCFVGIAAVQIGLTDVLRALEIVPDYIIGHSTGELVCAYADGCLTLEETILSAYWRGVASKQVKVIHGAMAAVGKGYNDLKMICPSEIEIACHNSNESSTVSGPVEILNNFIVTLRSRGVFAKEVACGNIAFHSKYVAAVGPVLLEKLQEIIKNPKQRTSKWLSTSFLQNRWSEDVATLSSAEYFTNNLLSPVYFEETSKLIPHDAVMIEIAPHGLLQAIVKRSHKSCVHVPLTRRGHTNPMKFFLEAIGRLYQSGLNPQMHVLYPKIEYPVATETPLLSNLVGWEHSENWPIFEDAQKIRKQGQINNYTISLYDDESKFLDGYTRNGVNVIPEALLLVLTWKTLAMSRNIDQNLMSVKFNNVYICREVSFGENKYVKIKVSIKKGDSKFEITHDDVVIASGHVTDDFEPEQPNFLPKNEHHENDILLTSDEIYRVLSFRGYYFNNEFQAIRSANLTMNKASVNWTGEWISYIDALIQLNVIKRNHNGISAPKLIRELIIDAKEHVSENLIETVEQHEATIFDQYNTTRCGGVTIKDIVFSDRPVIYAQASTVLLTEKFWPHFLEDDYMPLKTALYIQMQIIAENTSRNIVNVTELQTRKENLIKDVIQNIDIFNLNTVNIKNGGLQEYLLSSYDKNDEKLDALVIYNISENHENLRILHDVIRYDTFVMMLENKNYDESVYKSFCIVSAIGVDDGKKLLLMKKCRQELKTVADIDVIRPLTDFQHIERVFIDKSETMDANKRSIIVYDSKQNLNISVSGNLKHHLAYLRNRSKATNVMIIEDEEAPDFNVKEKFYIKQLKKNLIINSLKQGRWGGHYYTPVSSCVEADGFKLTMKIPNDFDSTSFEQIAISKSLSKKIIKVCYSGISQRDCQQPIFGNQSASLGLGMDFSGTDMNGEHVMGLVAGGALSSAVAADPELLWPVPRHWTLQEAATVPLPYVHAYYILNKAELVSGCRVLVVGGAGALGQAIISVCLSLGCTVYTTVSTLRKKRVLLNLFPKLKENNIICDSNHEVLFEHIVVDTDNQLCHTVVSCASGRLKEVAMKCICLFGNFLDINRYDMDLNRSFGMSYLEQDRCYKTVNLSSLFETRNNAEKQTIRRMIAEGISNGVVKPLSSITYDIEDVRKALKLLSSRNNVGRVLIKIKSHLKSKVVPRITCASEATYVVVCTEELLSLELIELLIYRGARNLIVLWNGSPTAYFLYKIRFWKESHSTVNIVIKSIINEKQCNNAIKEAEDIGSLEGIFLILSNDEKYSDNVSGAPKLLARHKDHLSMISNLDVASRNLCKNLRHFVVVSESSRNIYDEKVYLEAEKICKERQSLGHPGLAFRAEVTNQLSKYSNHSNNNMTIPAQTISAVLSALENSMHLNFYNIKAEIGIHGNKKDSPLTKNKEIDSQTKTGTLKTTDNNERNITKKVPLYSSSNGNGNSVLKQNTNGFGIFYSLIEKSVFELTSDPIVRMSTKAFEYFEDKLEIDANAAHLILIPGFEGHHRIFKGLCEPLKIRAVAVDLDTDLKSSSIQEMASNIYKSLSKNFDFNKKFYLLGYSFGVNVALELAALIEEQGQRGIVYCLDSSPDALKCQLKTYVGDLSNVNLQNVVAAHMFYLTTGLNSDDFKKELETIDSWYKKIEVFIERAKELVSYSHEYMRLLLETTYERLLLAREYQANFKLNSELVLIKSTTTAEVVNLTDDYNLGKYSKRPIKVYDIDGDHASVPYNIRIPSIINGSLEPKHVEEFNKTNTCETYLMYY